MKHWIFDKEKEKFNLNENIEDFYMDDINKYCTDSKITRDRKYMVSTNFGK